MVTTVDRVRKYRTVSCVPCSGQGVTLYGVSPAGNLLMGDCPDCDGRGQVSIPVARPAPAALCPDCRRPTIEFEGERICPTCVCYEPTDLED